MSQILLLTKNVLNEQSFEQRLRQLGHEVFTSATMIEACLLGTPTSAMINAFQHVVLSETIANSEVKELITRLGTQPLSILRKSDEKLDEAQLNEWKELGVTDWIESQPELEVLREKLSSEQLISNQKIIQLPTSPEKRTIANLSLSTAERRLFKILYGQKNQTVSREEICLRMWNKQKSNSSMSQLSVLVKHLKNKLAAHHIEGPIIETCWGQGYRLHDTVYEQVCGDEEETKIM